MFSKIRPEFPEAAFVAEWGRPNESMQAGFDMDFYLDWRWDGHPMLSPQSFAVLG